MRLQSFGVLFFCLGLTALSEARAALPIAGELSQIRGQVTVQPADRTQPRPALRFSLLHNGDIVNLAATASAQVSLLPGKTRYSLAGGSRVRVIYGHLLSLGGTRPQIQTSAAATQNLPAELFDRSRESLVVRGDGHWGPKNISPLFIVRGPDVTLRWEGPLNPSDAPTGAALLRVQVKDSKANRWVFTRDLSLDTRRVSLPLGTLVPGHWYTWRVQVIGPGDLPFAGGPLRLLTQNEQMEISKAEREIAAEYPGREHAGEANRLRAEAYLSFGLLTKALPIMQDKTQAAEIQRLLRGETEGQYKGQAK
jgi:hypothetical protein